ncbi:hypothetical protein GUITHDRAFT_160583 [Guillardia theta CCMP2712]|uniref:G-patch domain-containing protein n=1 Tax=Guillardia theta (strain CCMP2712) TaxID=905079 RepID=L1K323_GUITC|nr:hypothetical protein GUITHDRAFT_160583 [Guillardia theta CCMP2712]EKX55009.1 hypothetical protein GUITHDRAFT_160583 [Guillardia theta CCMP2712]|eukprot:XP_005841989.1 hypothetical protein GUITHDRAFT_160583 [Guillardia theta CCMP2712]
MNGKSQPDDETGLQGRENKEDTVEVEATEKEREGTKKEEEEVKKEEEETDDVRNSVGFALLLKMGWKEGEGLGLHKQGRRDPIIVDAEEREPYAGLAHASEVNPFSKLNSNKKAIHELESWEIEEKRRDFFKGSDSSMWVSAGLLEDQDKNVKGKSNHVSSPTITSYKDAWDDKVVSEWKLRTDEDSHEASWEDSWAHVMNRDLEKMTINLEHFFACCHVVGPFVKMLHMETTGEIFQSNIWASSSKDLQNILERKLRSRSRVLRLHTRRMRRC